MKREFFDGFKIGVKTFNQTITAIINTILLTFVYVVGIGIPSIIAKLFGKHFLDIKPSKKDTYWSDLNIKTKPLNEYYKQF